MASILIPEYMNKFSCIGSKCQETCCQGWNIFIDKKTYLKYQKVKDELLAPMFAKYCKRNFTHSNDRNYAFFETDGSGKCHFATKEGLCLIQQRLGAEFLSNTCHNYPRYINLVNNGYEICGVFSCPEITRLALLNSEKTRFTMVDSSQISFRAKELYQIFDQRLYTGKWQYYSLQLRNFAIQILQDRSCSLTSRLLFLGIFLKKVQECIDKDLSKLPELLNQYQNMLGKDIAASLGLNVNHKISMQYQILQSICLLEARSSQLYSRVFEDFLRSISGTKNTQEQVLFYQQSYLNYYKSYFQEKEYFFENYLVNYVFNDIFPFSIEQSVFASYLELIINFALLRFHIITIAGIREGINDDSIIQTTFQFARSYNHNLEFIQYLLQLVKDHNLSSLAHMIILLQDPSLAENLPLAI